MAMDPETIGIIIGTVFTSIGGSIGGQKLLDKRRQASSGDQPSFCAEHYKCFEEIKDTLNEVKESVAYIKGKIDGVKS